ncbi:acyltransferase [Roseateles violae]|uniref:Acyltransferase n=1 Tax=Roseateles violae TaxID=3058042 RepID=A0ABT8DRH7_9BURK|nr:acyltransferase [Pelomonas sp. PFR6]MDN3920949.1 acyltransferase [Pelomonas sp. PFR6]
MSPRNIYRRLLSMTWWRWRFGAFGRNSVLFPPILVTEPERIFIGADVLIRDGARLEVVRPPGATWTPELRIGDRVNIEQGVHIVCQSSVVIEEGVSITPYCAIVDTYHPHDPPDCGPKIGARLPERPTHVHIGAGTFIGTHSVILPDVTIGRGCIIGAGSVVSKDIPDYCIATGAPARVVKRFDLGSRQWLTQAEITG